MKMDVNIALYNGVKATYNVEQVDDTTYTIRLKNYTGDSKPPLFIRLYKTDKGWNSAFSDVDMIKDIGEAIDAA